MQPTMVKIPKKIGSGVSSHRMRALEEELALLRSAIVGLVGEDSEGRYRPEFVERVLASSRTKPTHTFKDAKTFLRQLREV